MFVWEAQVDGPAGQPDESEDDFGGVEPVAALHHEPDLGVERFDSAVRDAVLDGVEDPLSPVTHGAGGFDERGEAGALHPGTPRSSASPAPSRSRPPAKTARNAPFIS